MALFDHGVTRQFDAPLTDRTRESAESAVARTARARVAFGAVSLLALVLGGLGLVSGLDAIRTAGLLVFCLMGIGAAPWQLNVWLRLSGRLTLSGLTGLVTLVLVAAAMALTGAWYPWPAFLLVLAVAVPLHVVGLRRATSDLRSARRDAGVARGLAMQTATPVAWYRRWAQVTTAGTGAVLCLLAAFTHQHLDPQFGGFTTQIGLFWFIGLALILGSIVLFRTGDEWQLAVTVTLLMVVLTLTPGLIYDGPRSQSAAKHVDLIEQIRTLHQLDSSVAIYNAWPGFFGATAWLSDITGIDDPMRLARFWPALIGLFRLTALRYFFGKVLRNPYQVWIATALAVLADPQGADYFSPQSVGFVIGLAVFGLALSTGQSRTRLVLMLAAGCALAVSHQLSPYIVGGVLVVLVIFQQIRPWWTPVVILGPAMVWTGAHYAEVRSFISFRDFGAPANFLPPSTASAESLDRLPIVGFTVYAFAASVLIVGALAALTLFQHRRDLRFWAMACAPAVGLVLVLVSPYGNEGIFRAVLFATPWLALLAAHLFRPMPTLGGRLPLLALVTVLTALFVLASSGMDRTNVIRSGDLAALSYFSAQGEQSGQQFLMVLGKGDLPNSPPRSEETERIVTRDTLLLPVAQELDYKPDEQVAQLTESLRDYALRSTKKPDLYALWSPTSSDYDWAYGIQTPEQFDALRGAFDRSAYWSQVLQRDGTVVYRLDPVTFDAVHG